MEDNIVYYFMFSPKQLKDRKAIEAKINRVYSPKEVRVNGVFKQYTERITDPKNATYSDAIVVISGKISDLVFKD